MIPRAVVVLLGLTLLAGCGGSSYDKKFEDSLTEVRNEAPFLGLWKQPVSIPLTAAGEKYDITLRVPRLFDTQTGEAYALDQNTLDPRNSEATIDPERLWPNFLQVGFHVRTYERIVNVQPHIQNQARVPVRCYIALVRNEKEGGAGNLLDDLQNRLEKRFAKSDASSVKTNQKPPVGKWIPIRVRTPDGKSREVQKIEARGKLPLSFYEAAGKPEIKQATMLVECLLYLVPGEQTTVILAWLMPKELVVQENIDSPENNPSPNHYPLARAMAGTVLVTTVPLEEAAETN